MPTDINFPQQQPTYSPPPPPPRAKSSVWKWVLGGCLGLVAIGMIGIFMLTSKVMNDPGFKKIIQNAQSTPETKNRLQKVKNGIEKYRKAHDGKYPDSLDALVKANYLSASGLISRDDTGAKFIYNKPSADAGDEFVLVSTKPDKATMFGKAESITSMHLLKDGTITTSQDSRPLETSNPKTDSGQ
ncbi:MAG: type II secretion system protein [Chthonomonadaceae bacterium]|nr:type II secretion system protein [Chthonomonadaceae bacterium]